MAVPENIWKTGILKITGLLMLFVVATNITFFLLTRLFLIKPMEYISVITDRIRRGDYDARVEIEGSREVLSLADNINNMAETIKNDIALLNLVIENMKLGFLVYDEEGEIVLINREAKEVLNVSVGDPVTPHFPFLPGDPAESRQGFFAGVKIYDRAGVPLFADVALSSFRQGQGFSHALALQEIEDITHHNNSRLISFMRSLTLMLAHEIKNPLNVMGMITQMAEKKFGSDPMWDDFRNEERNMTAVIDAFSSFFDISPHPFDLRDYVQNWVAKWRKIYTEKEILLETRFDETGKINFDSRRLGMILDNLIKNTLENGVPGCRAVLDLSEGDGKIYLVLKDNTGGIQKETLFKFLDGGHSTKDESRGWGLALVRLLLHLGGADLEIKGGADQETEVRLTFEKYESPHR
jgi:nitrogen fixation/metabolism regulation signal transduction histidine kinase